MLKSVDIGNATLYCGDCREILPTLPPADAIITDPVWPNAPGPGAWAEHGWPDLRGIEDPQGLLAGMFSSLTGLPARAVIVLRNDSDPRFLQAVPAALPFFRTQLLSYVLPGRIGRKLGGDELAYGFGTPPLPYREDRTLMPGRSPVAQPTKASGHPCGRSEKHFEFLVHWWSSGLDIVVDPFMGGGTTGVACARLGQPFVGIGIEPKYFDLACERIDQAQRQQRIA
jgi:site-specific DNA-methyltransferase (adenine-specific)